MLAARTSCHWAGVFTVGLGLRAFYTFLLLFTKTASAGGIVSRRPETAARSSAMDNPPNANIHTIVKAQIVFLLSTLTEDNFDRNQLEIRSVRIISIRLVVLVSLNYSYFHENSFLAF